MKTEPEPQEANREPWAWMWKRQDEGQTIPWETRPELPLIDLYSHKVRVLYTDGTWEDLPSGEELDRWRRQRHGQDE